MKTGEELSAEIAAALEKIPGAAELLDAFVDALGHGVAIFGGAVRDIIAFGQVGHDIDILTFGSSKDDFRSAALSVAAKLGAATKDQTGTHIALTLPSSDIFFDFHYPKRTFLEGLVRSDFTVNGIGYLWPERKLEDPLGGVSDLQNRRLVIHSPQYIVTDAPTFPRMFRTAARLGVPIDAEAEKILRRFSPLISLHQGKTNLRTLFEMLRFFSHPLIAPYLRKMHEVNLIEGLFPELAIASETRISQGRSILTQNVERACSFDDAGLEAGVKQFLNDPIGEGVTNRSLVRLMSLFLNLGESYERYKPEAPFIKGVSGGNKNQFATRTERNLLAHIGARYKDSPELRDFFIELPAVFHSIRMALEKRDQHYAASDLSPLMQPRATLLYGKLLDESVA